MKLVRLKAQTLYITSFQMTVNVLIYWICQQCFGQNKKIFNENDASGEFTVFSCALFFMQYKC